MAIQERDNLWSDGRTNKGDQDERAERDDRLIFNEQPAPALTGITIPVRQRILQGISQMLQDRGSPGGRPLR